MRIRALVPSARWCFDQIPLTTKVHVAKNQNTFEKRRREVEKKQRAEEKRKRRQVRKDVGPAPVHRPGAPPDDTSD